MASRGADAVRIIEAHQRVEAAVRERVAAFIRTTFLGLGSYRDHDIARFVDLVVPVVLAGQRRTAALTDAYLGQLAAAMIGGSTRPAGITTRDLGRLRGISPSDVYRRPIVQVWTALAHGKSYREAVDAGLRRALSLGMTDLQLAKRITSQRVLGRDHRVVGYRRTLTGRESCGLCALASTQRYHREQLLPIHPGCNCGVAPIYGNQDPGHVIDQAVVDNVHAAIAERFGTTDTGGRLLDYRKHIVVREHGEMGPTLTVRGQRFTGPDDIAA